MTICLGHEAMYLLLSTEYVALERLVGDVGHMQVAFETRQDDPSRFWRTLGKTITFGLRAHENLEDVLRNLLTLKRHYLEVHPS